MMGLPEKKGGPSILMMIGKDKGKAPEDEPDTRDDEGDDEDVSDSAVQDLAEAFGIDPAKVDVAKARAAIEDICESKYGSMRDEG
jgi:hypothetical protein